MKTNAARGLGLATLGALILWPSSAMADGPRQTATIGFTTTAPGAATGTTFAANFVNPDDPAVKPYSVARIVVHYPPGTVIDTAVPPQCQASDAELMLQGPSACPADTRIGGGTVESDTGAPAGFPRHTETTVSLFNNRNEQIGVGVTDGFPVNTVSRSKISGTTVTSDVPPFPGLPPPDSYTPWDQVRLSGPAYVRNGRAYTRTPRTCPGGGHWTFRLEFTYHDGITQEIDSVAPCAAPARGARHRRRHHRR